MQTDEGDVGQLADVTGSSAYAVASSLGVGFLDTASDQGFRSRKAFILIPFPVRL